jgi:4-hydroxy-tetrahydrodipicolinate synthase
VNIMLYNIPIFTGVNLDPATVGRLAELPNIVAIKEEAELNPKQITAFLNATPEHFIVYNGDDTMILEAYAQGGAARIGGVVSGASHVVGPYIRTMIETFLSGRVAEAAQQQRRLYPLLKIMGQNGRTNPVSLWKEALRLWGVDAGIPRLPLSRGTPDEIANVRRALTTFGVL